jgi:Tol biopolymer transport system component/DNA-binding winged helix-turn-helix (wHTH) protein
VASQYRWDDFVLDLETFRLERRGTPLALEPKAFSLLTLFVERPGRLITKQEIFESIWPDTVVTDHALTRVVAQLRRVLGDEAREARYIETVPTRGYRWIRSITPPTSNGPAAPSALIAPNAGVAAAAPVAPVAAPGSRPSLLIAVLLTAAVLVLAYVLWSERGGTTSATATSADMETARHDVMWPVQVTTRNGLELQPALAPTGDALAYVSDRTGALEIYIRSLDGTAVDTPLTTDGAQNVQPAWSPDGRFIAYHSYKNGGIWIVPARGGVPRQIAAQGSHPAWAPDGSRLAFQSDEPADVSPSAWGAQTGSTLWLVNADGSGLTPLTRMGAPIGGHAAPAWNRDGRYIAFAVFEGAGDNGAWVLEVASGAVRRLGRGAGLYELVFATDDSAVYIAGGEAALVRIGFDATTGTPTGQRQIIPVAGVAGVRGLSMSADGRTIAFAGLAVNSQIWSVPVRPDGTPAGEARAITSDTSRRNSLATVSPDGTKVAYMSRRGGAAPDVHLMNVDGSNSISLTGDESADGKPQWFADGQRVAYVSNRNNMRAIWSVDVATRRNELLFEHGGRVNDVGDVPGNLTELQLSPTMTRMALSLLTPTAHRRLYVATLSPFAARPLTDGSESVGYPAWSPDERYLAVEIKDGSSMHAGVVDVASGALRRLTNERGQSWVRSWSPDSRRIALAALRDGLWSLRAVDAMTGAQQTMLPPSPPNTYVRYPEWSPAGDLVVFERGELRGNIWTLRIK